MVKTYCHNFNESRFVVYVHCAIEYLPVGALGAMAILLGGDSSPQQLEVKTSGNENYPGPWTETQPDPTGFPYRITTTPMNNTNYFQPGGLGLNVLRWGAATGAAAALGKGFYDGMRPENPTKLNGCNYK